MNEHNPTSTAEHCFASGFTIISKTLNCSEIASGLPWRITESCERGAPTGQAHPALHPFSLVAFDLGVPPSDRADFFLRNAIDAIKIRQKLLRSRFKGRGLALWIAYNFTGEGAINLNPTLMRSMADLGIELIFHLNSPPNPRRAQ